MPKKTKDSNDKDSKDNEKSEEIQESDKKEIKEESKKEETEKDVESLEEDLETLIQEFHLLKPEKTKEIFHEKTLSTLEEDLQFVPSSNSNENPYSPNSNSQYNSSNENPYSSSSSAYESSPMNYETKVTPFSNIDVNTGREIQNDNPFNSSGVIRNNFQQQNFSETYQGKLDFSDAQDLGKTKKKKLTF